MLLPIVHNACILKEGAREVGINERIKERKEELRRKESAQRYNDNDMGIQCYYSNIVKQCKFILCQIAVGPTCLHSSLDRHLWIADDYKKSNYIHECFSDYMYMYWQDYMLLLLLL